jgi:hypothetical protein
LKGINIGLEVRTSDHSASGDKTTDTDLTLSDGVTTADSHETGTARYGSAEVSITDNNTGRDIPGGSAITAESEDAVFIVPDDPALIGTPMVVTGTVSVTASAHVTGDRAQAQWGLTLVIENGITDARGVISTLSGQNVGNISGGTASATGTSLFGLPITPQISLSVGTFYACDSTKEMCPPRSAAGTGTGQASASMQWTSLTVKDQNGNAVGFTECSVSGFKY